MKKRLFCILLSVCVVITCVLTFSACGPQVEPPEFYGKTFILEELTVNYSADMNCMTTLDALLEENLQYIDWQRTIRANSSSIDYATFEEEVTTIGRAKEIISTFGQDMLGATITFNTKDAKTATMVVGEDSEQIVVDDKDSQGAYAALKSTSGEEFARVSLNYDEDTNEILFLQFMPNVARSFTVYFTQELQLLGMTRSDIVFTAEINFVLQK